MYFDQACKIIEQWLPQYKHVLMSSALFELDVLSYQDLDRTIPSDELEFLTDHFFLPFQYVAIEDKTGIVFLYDHSPDTVGLCKQRQFIDFMYTSADLSIYRPEERRHILEMTKSVPIGTFIVSAGEVEMSDVNVSGWDTFGSVNDFLMASTKQLVMAPHHLSHMNRQERNDVTKPAIQNAITAIEEIRLLNSPDRFIVEVIPHRLRPKPKKIPRSHERSRYTLLTPFQIRDRLNITMNGTKKSSHPRRRHIRRLRSEKYTKARGKSIIIPATWVGPTEGQVGNKRYKVRVDL